MIELLQHYTVSEIIIFVILLALAIKSLISFFDWVRERISKNFDKGYKKINAKKQLERRLQHGSEIMTTLQKNQEQIDHILNDLTKKIDMLIDSDKDDIKAYITEKHHYYCYQMGWIDDFSLNCLEKRFKHYQDEGGNSFIANFMEELRALPKTAPPA